MAAKLGRWWWVVAVAAGASWAAVSSPLAQAPEPIAELQTLLLDHGCDPGPVDGQWGSRTASALGALAAEVGISVERPITAEHLAALGQGNVRCSPYFGMGIVEAARSIPPEQVRGWSRLDMVASARANASYCQLGDRHGNGWVAPLALQAEIEIVGQDLANYKSMTDALVVDLHRLNAEAAATEDYAALKAMITEVVETGSFTQMKRYVPDTWEGTRPDWVEWYGANIPEAEPAFNAAIVLIPASISYALLNGSLTAEEQAAFQAWGDTVFGLAANARLDGMGTADARRGAGDRRAAYAAGFLAWGATTGNREAFLRGAELYEEGVLRIRRDGTERGFVQGQENSGLELKYQNFAYGLLTVAAYVLELNDIPAFGFRRGDSGSLVDGLRFHFAATDDPVKRIRMVADQNLDYANKVRGWGADTVAYLALVEAMGALGPQDTTLDEILRRAERNWPPGFAGDYYGGYTTCLFRGGSD